MPVDNARAKEIFLAAIEIHCPASRAAFLDAACAGDGTLRRRVEALIGAHQDTESLLGHAGVAAIERWSLDIDGPIPLEVPAGTAIGPYTLIEPIGEGGMGVVYMAEQAAPLRRKVALKIIKPGMDTRQVVARFEAERQALAMMDHPSIARVFEAGSTGAGRPYFAMELVRGVPITEYCDGERLDIPDRLRLFAAVCLAVEHAHQKGIIHRDLKPSNILVTVIDGRAIPKVIDFGVAKAMTGRLTEDTLHTGFHQFVGTPLYMSPEQAVASGVDADTRSDIYALGVLLYELLAGSTPIDRDAIRDSSHEEIRRIIRDVDPPKPSTRLGASGARLVTIAADRRALPRTLRRSVRGELDWMTMKALEKDRARRYQTAGALAADVGRYLDGMPLEAGPPSARYRFKKFARRNKALLTTASLVAIALIAGTVVSAWQAIRATGAERRMAAALAEAEESRNVAEEHRRRIERHLRNSTIQQAWQAIDFGQVERAQEILADTPFVPASRDFSRDYVRRQASREVQSLFITARSSSPFTITPKEDRLAYMDLDGYVVLWDLTSNRPRARLGPHSLQVQDLNFSPDGERLVSAAADHDRGSAEIRVWDVPSARMLAEIRPAEALLLHGARFMAGGRLLLVFANTMGLPRVDRTHYFDLASPDTPPVYLAPGRWIVPTPDGEAIGNFAPGRIARRDLITGKESWSIPMDGPDVRSLAVSPEGSKIIVPDRSRAIVLDAATGAEIRRMDFPYQVGTVRSIIAGINADRFAAIDRDGILLSARNRPRLSLHKSGRSNEGFLAALSPRGQQLAVTTWGIPGGQGPLYIYSFFTGKGFARYPGRGEKISSIQFSVDKQSLFISSANSIKRWYFNVSRRKSSPAGHAEEVWAVAFSPDGAILASGSDNTRPGDTIKLWDLKTLKCIRGWRVTQGTVSSLAFSPDGKVLASACLHRSDNLHLWDTATGRLRASLKGHADRVRAVAFSPDGKVLASAGSDQMIRLWDGEEGRPIAELAGHSDTVRGLAFSPDGRMLASAANDDTVRLWDVETRGPIRTIRGPRKFVAVAFAPDGSALAATDQGEGITLWDPATGNRRLAIHGHDEELLAMAFCPDGQTLTTAGLNGAIRLWDVMTGQELLRLKGHKAQVNGLAFSPDGKTLASCDHDGAVKLWRSEDPRTDP